MVYSKALDQVYMEMKFLGSLILTFHNLNNTLDENEYMKKKEKINPFLANIPILYL